MEDCADWGSQQNSSLLLSSQTHCLSWALLAADRSSLPHFLAVSLGPIYHLCVLPFLERHVVTIT